MMFVFGWLRALARDAFEITVTAVALFGAVGLVVIGLGGLVDACAPPAAAAPARAEPSPAVTMHISGADLEPGVRIYQVHSGLVTCYVVVGEMTGMAGGKTAALDCD